MASVMMPAGLVKFIRYACGASSLHQPGDLHHHRHGPDRVRQTARPGRLLADHVEVEGDVLVAAAPFQAADPDGGEDEVAALDGRPQRGGGHQLRGVVEADGELLEDHRHGAQPILVDVVQGDLGDPRRTAVAEEGLVDVRGAESSAAQDAELHAMITCPPAFRHKSRVLGLAPAVVTTESTSDERAQAQRAGAGELGFGGQQHHPVGGGDHRLLDRRLHGHVVHHVTGRPDPRTAEEQQVGADLGERGLGQRPDERAVVAPEDPAQHHQPDASSRRGARPARPGWT